MSQTEQLKAEEVTARNAKVGEVQANICSMARLSPHGSLGMGFFDAIMEVYLFGRDAGAKAGYIAAKEDAATIAENCQCDNHATHTLLKIKVAAAIRKLEPKP